jgi:hypothetical protein
MTNRAVKAGCICVIDGQGGGIGATIVKLVRQTYGESVEIIALGTNAIATARMLRAGANRGASGENAICRILPRVDAVLGPISISWPNAMHGEVTGCIAEAVIACPAGKILIPLYQENTDIVGIINEPLPHLVDLLVTRIKEVIGHV